MTTQTLNSRPRGIAIPGAGLFRKIAAFAESYSRAMDAHQAYLRLSGMSERQLAAIGLTRDDVPQFVAQRYF